MRNPPGVSQPDACVDFLAAWRPDRGLSNYKLLARSVLDDIPHSKLIAESSLGSSLKGHNRPRYLTEVQLNQLNQGRSQGPLRATRQHVDLLITARHGLRVTEAVDLHWDQVDFAKGYLHIRRLKKRH